MASMTWYEDMLAGGTIASGTFTDKTGVVGKAVMEYDLIDNLAKRLAIAERQIELLIAEQKEHKKLTQQLWFAPGMPGYVNAENEFVATVLNSSLQQ